MAARPIEDMDAYRQKLIAMTYHTGPLMRPLYMQAKAAPKRIIYADGEDERVLRAVQTVVDEKLAQPILVGRPSVIDMRVKKDNDKVIEALHAALAEDPCAVEPQEKSILVDSAVASDDPNVVAASDEARRRIERDLHDGIQQQLVSIGMELG